VATIKIVLFSFLFLLLEGTVVPKIAVWSAAPNLIVGLIAYVALARGPVVGAVYGFVIGLLVDITGPGLAGVSALAGATIGYVVGVLRSSFYREGLWTQAAVLAASVVLWDLLVLAISGGTSIGGLFAGVFTTGLLEAVYTALLCPVLLIGVRRTVWTDLKLDA
jgi:rod shape-determining protein MreD